MLGIGISELMVIGLVVLLVVGPEDLPRMMRELGKRYGQLRRAADELRRAFVMEADRQDAQERYKAMQERRKQAVEARKKALEQAGAGAVPQKEHLPGTSDVGEEDANRAPEGGARLAPPPELDDPELPAPPRRAAAGGAAEEGS